MKEARTSHNKIHKGLRLLIYGAPVLLAILAASCVTVVQESQPLPSFVAPEKKSVQKGMLKQEVLLIAAKPVVVGFELANEKTAEYKPIVVNNPYKTEKISRASKQYDVVYIYQQSQIFDGVVTDQEILPLIFLNDRLIGVGYPELEKIKKLR